jgi:hypothetical protein
MAGTFKIRWDTLDPRCDDDNVDHESGFPYFDHNELVAARQQAWHVAHDALVNAVIAGRVYITQVVLDGYDAGGATFEVTVDGEEEIADDLGGHIHPMTAGNYSVVM